MRPSRFVFDRFCRCRVSAGGVGGGGGWELCGGEDRVGAGQGAACGPGCPGQECGGHGESCIWENCGQLSSSVLVWGIFLRCGG